MHRPKDVTQRLGISSATLRLWSTHFEQFLSPGAQSAKTENGGPAQRRYQDSDIALLQTAKTLLAEGLTYEEVKERLGTGLETPTMPVEAPQLPKTDNSPALVMHLALQPLREALSAKDQTIAASEQTVRSQQQTIDTQASLIAQLTPAPASEPVDSSWWSRMLRAIRKGAEPTPEGLSPTPAP